MYYLYAKLAIAAMLGAIFVGKVALQARYRAKLRARMALAPATISDLSLVTLVGTVKLLETSLDAPISGASCVFHHVTAHVHEPGHKAFGVRQVERSFVVTAMVPFVLETADGEVIVDGTTAETTLRARPIIPRRVEREVAFLETHEVPRTRVPDTSLVEVRIEPGDTIAVHGIARVEVDVTRVGARPFRDTGTAVRLVGDEQHPITIDARR